MENLGREANEEIQVLKANVAVKEKLATMENGDILGRMELLEPKAIRDLQVSMGCPDCQEKTDDPEPRVKLVNAVCRDFRVLRVLLVQCNWTTWTWDQVGARYWARRNGPKE